MSRTAGTELVLDWLRNNNGIVEEYLFYCKRHGVLPSCSDFISCYGLDWERVYLLNNAVITKFFREKFRG